MSAHLEKAALREFVNQRPDAAALLLGIADDDGDLFAVAEQNAAACAVDRELPRKVFQQPAAIGSDQVLKIVYSTEAPPIGKLAAGVDGGTELEANADE